MLTATATANRTRVEPLEAGSYPARCVQIIDLGFQFNVMAQKTQRQVMLVWELPTETITIDGEEKPRVISDTYTLSLNENAKLYKTLIAWRGRAFTDDELRGFDLQNVLDKVCILNLSVKESKTGNKYNRIAGVSKVMKGMTVAEAVTPIFSFDLDSKEALEQMKSLPNWIQEKIKGGETYKELVNNSSLGETTAEEQFTNINPEELPF